MNKDYNQKISSLVFKSVGLGLGVAVLVLNLLGNIENDNSIRLLSLGIIVYGLYLMQED